MRNRLLMLIAACLFMAVSSASSADTIKIGFLVKLPEEQWFQDEWRYAQQCADTYGFELIKIGIPDEGKTLTAIDSLAAQGAQGFVICPPDVHLGPAIMARAEKYGLKVFSVDDRLLDTDGSVMDVPYMGFSSQLAGTLIGEALHEEFIHRAWPVEETAVLAVTFDELETARQSTENSIEALIQKGFPAENIFRAPEESTDIAGAFEAANAVLFEQQHVKRWLVCSFNDDGVLGAVRALEFMDFDAETIIAIGIGNGAGFMEFQEAQPTGYFASLFINPYRQGYESTERLYTWIMHGVEPPKETFTSGIFVTRENYQDVLDELDLKP